MAEKLNIRGMNIEARCKPSDQGLEIWRLAGFTHQSNFTYQTLVEWSFFSKKKKNSSGAIHRKNAEDAR